MSDDVEQQGVEAEAPTEAQEAPETAPQEQETESRFNKRIGALRAQLGTAARERDEMAARVAALEQQMRDGGQPAAQPDPQLEAVINQEAERRAEARRVQDRINTFHEAGRNAYPDWSQRCTELQGMGADAMIAQLLVEMPDGHRVAGALHEDPDALMHIASMRGERARAMALGQYAAKLEAQPTRNVSRVPAPPKPVSGRAQTRYDPYLETDPNKLVDIYMKEAMEKRRHG